MHRASLPIIALILSIGVPRPSLAETVEGAEAAEEAAIRRVESDLLPTWWIKGREPDPQSLADRMAHYRTPAISVAVILDGEIAWARAWGQADREAGRPATPETRFQAASISKPIAAVALLDLVQAGRIDLDGDVNDDLKRWQVPASEFTTVEKVTPRRLLNHSAGLTVWGFPGYAPDADRADAVGVLEGKGNTDPVEVFRTPGAAWQYSGGGYTVLQVLMEDVTGRPFAEMMAERVLTPLGMAHSTYAQPLPAALHGRAATAYGGEYEAVEGGWHVYPEQAAAGLWTTPTDLARYLLFVQRAAGGDAQAGPLTPATVAVMLTASDGDHGLGPGIDPENGTFGHGGSNEGFRCNMRASIALEDGWGAVFMTNSNAGAALGHEVTHALARHYGWPGFEPEIKTVVPMTKAELAPYAGRFDVPDFGRLTIEAGDGELLISGDFFPDTDRYLPEGDHAFFDAEDRQRFEFEFEDGRAVRAIVSGRITATRVED